MVFQCQQLCHCGMVYLTVAMLALLIGTGQCHRWSNLSMSITTSGV